MKLSTKQNWLLTLMAIALLSGLPAKAQVTIGDQKMPETFSILELVSGNNKGLRLPQITNSIQRDAQITNVGDFKSNPLYKGLQIYNLDAKQVETWDGNRWVVGSANSGEAIWLPSTSFAWGAVGTPLTEDLFAVYAKAFNPTATYGTIKYISSALGNVSIPCHTNDQASDFYYVITDYDENAIENLSITSNGIFSYTPKTTNSDGAWVNILLVRK